MSADDEFKVAWQRERKARMAAEQLLEDKSRELYLANQELIQTNEQLVSQQQMLIRQEKLATLGTLSAGVAHEINNPLSFVLSNLRTLKRNVECYSALYQHVCGWQQQQLLPEDLSEQLAQLIDEQDLAFVEEDIYPMLEDTDNGLVRLRDIVQGLRHFSHGGDAKREPYNLEQGLESTLTVLQSELKKGVLVEKQFAGIPPVSCNPGEINQVFLNLIVNACQALAAQQKPILKLITSVQDQLVIVRVLDNGCGMDEQVQAAIFDPFFTTKAVGEGTGMGLSISYGIIKDHGGSIEVKSIPDKGTAFEIRLPQQADSE